MEKEQRVIKIVVFQDLRFESSLRRPVVDGCGFESDSCEFKGWWRKCSFLPREEDETVIVSAGDGVKSFVFLSNGRVRIKTEDGEIIQPESLSCGVELRKIREKFAEVESERGSFSFSCKYR